MSTSSPVPTLGWKSRHIASNILRAMEGYRQEVADRLKRLIAASAFDNHEDLAHEAGVSVKTVSRLVNARNEPRRETVRRLAKALGVKPVDIAGTPPAPLGLGQNGASADPAMVLAALVGDVHEMGERLDHIDDKLELILAAVGVLPTEEEGDAQDQLIEGTELEESPPSDDTDCSDDRLDPPPESDSG